VDPFASVKRTSLLHKSSKTICAEKFETAGVGNCGRTILTFYGLNNKLFSVSFPPRKHQRKKQLLTHEREKAVVDSSFWEKEEERRGR